jgi:alkyl sulfatase BDS1-like metallo-beta-lactamase superfamily hydrolase
MTRIIAVLLALLSAAALAAPIFESKPASPATIAAHARARAELPLDDGQDEEFVKRGFIADVKDPDIRRADGKLVWRVGSLDWIKGEAPPTVHPSLWRHAKLLASHGLYKITEGVWQVRGLDAANMHIVSGKSGWIVIDPLMTTETAAAAMKLVTENLGERPVSAIIYGHSHPDHFGGVRAVITQGTNPPIYAPEHLVFESSSENVIAGTAMSRRTAFQFGISLKPGERGYVSSGVVEASAAGGTVTLVPPTDSIRRTGETREIDGVTFEFQMVPETEAPAEMNFGSSGFGVGDFDGVDGLEAL